MTKTPWPRKRTREHIDRLASDHGIAITWVRDWFDAESYPDTKIVFIPKPSCIFHYLVALHEFGHILDKDSRRLRKSSPYSMSSVLACEGHAWGWAMDHAIPEARPRASGDEKVWQGVARSFASHLIYP